MPTLISLESHFPSPVQLIDRSGEDMRLRIKTRLEALTHIHSVKSD